MPPPLPLRVVVGVDGSGRTRRLRETAPRGYVLIPTHADAESIRTLIAAAGEDLLLLDDAHDRSPQVVATVLTAVSDGARVAMSRRPGSMSAALAELEDAVLQTGSLSTLAPMGRPEVASLLADGGATVDPALVDRLHSTSGGAPWVVAAMVGDRRPDLDPADPAAGAAGWPTLQAATQRRLTRLSQAAVELVDLLAVAAGLGAGMDEEVLSAAFSAGADRAPDASPAPLPPWRELYLAGLIDGASGAPPPGRLVPAVARVVREALAPQERRAYLARLAGGLRGAGADPLTVATGEVAWGAGSVDEALVEAGRWALRSRTDRVAECLSASPSPLHRSLAVPALVALGRDGLAAEVLAGCDGPSSDAALLFARAVAAITGGAPPDVLPALIEAAETFQARSVTAVVPETPHAVAAVMAVAAGDHATGERLLTSAADVDAGGAAARLRHRLLSAWLRLRAGRGDPLPLLRDIAGASLEPRDAMVRTVLLAGSARRRSDISALRACWDQVAQDLARRCVDLFALELVEELVLAAVRLDEGGRAAGIMRDLTEMAPPGVAAWQSGLAWLDLQIAVLGDDAGAAAAAAARATAAAGLATAGPRQHAQAGAATAWADALAGDVDTERILSAVDALVAAAELPWEGGRLAGTAALRTTDPRAARRLLERARELSWASEPRPSTPGGSAHPGATADVAGVSERELEVAQLVLAGRTHREIGSQLFISPKTVEHHVARIRTKVGARDRAEFMSALRALVAERA